ncbi:3-phosphoserine/phosphohydroxythreonine transaminase [Anaeromyxobacter dehalogenans]|uniref:Phosphoserine aminotransferase n=1 Tax=Anaeromyxobacter dehalogenans (strain 2CP-C) TaxID=290397 RepID=Q2IL63_ANADE|nr:3-phosphoserine/phosphohydroxythreonine transaminase [Anaeromyxobacter dehalogenans]ABC82392.1 phosphoserine aminotransferase apoenzyme [Anaeromyxobacter dehalogenans 2CP-C]
MSRVKNFNAGPAALPLPALERARDEFLDFAGSGMSVMEHSHRGKEYEAVHDEALALLRELLGVPDTYDVLFVQGGASQLFAQIPMNLVEKGRGADYLVTGAWGEKAFSEAKVATAMLGASARLAGTTGEGEGKEKRYVRAATAADLQVSPDAAYLHLTSNETIHGVQFAVDPARPFPDAGKVPLVADMSSDFLWKPVDVSRFGLVYAGAQKNIGPSGVVVVIVRKDLVAAGRKDIPKIFQLRTPAENKSLYNTPPTFGIYMIRNVLAWLKGLGGLGAMEQRNRAKAGKLYGVIDANAGYYRCPVEQESRSVMNVVFRLPTEADEERFVKEAKAKGMVGLKGHRSVGGIRVSTYNAVEPAWLDELCAFMQDFAKRG